MTTKRRTASRRVESSSTGRLVHWVASRNESSMRRALVATGRLLGRACKTRARESERHDVLERSAFQAWHVIVSPSHSTPAILGASLAPADCKLPVDPPAAAPPRPAAAPPRPRNAIRREDVGGRRWEVGGRRGRRPARAVARRARRRRRRRDKRDERREGA